MSNNCEYVVGGFTKKSLPIDMDSNNLQKKINTLYPITGQILSIKSILNTNKDKSIHDYLSLVYEDYTPFSDTVLQDSNYNKELIDNLKEIESSNSITIKAMNSINNFDDIVKLEAMSDLYSDLLYPDYVSEIKTVYNGKAVEYRDSNLYVDNEVVDIKEFMKSLQQDINDINTKININSKDVLGYYLNNKEIDGYYKAISNLLLENLNKVNNPIVQFDSSLIDEDTGGVYYFRDNKIVLAKLDKSAFIHELIHAYTIGVIYKQESGLDLTVNEDKFINNVSDLYNKAIEYNKKNGNQYFYGLKNIQEFISEGLTDKSFQEFLYKIKLEKKKSNMFSKLINAITDLISGIKEETDNTALSELINTTMDYIVNNDITDTVNYDINFKYSRLLDLNNTISNINKLKQSNHTVSIEEDSGIITIINNDTKDSLKIDADSPYWSTLIDLYEDNNENIYPTILEDYLEELNKARTLLREEMYKKIGKNPNNALKNILDKLKISDNNYYKELLQFTNNDYIISYVSEEDTLNLTISPEEGTKISHCQ